MREELIQNAVSFLNDPQVVDATLAKRVEFLESKELTKDEIEEALKRANQGSETSSSNNNTSAGSRKLPSVSNIPGNGANTSSSIHNQPPPLPQRDWRDYFVMATVTAGVGYGLYEVAKRYVVPLIMPPTPSSLEQDKNALESEFERVQTMLDQMQKDTEEIKSAEQERKDKFNVLVEEVESVVENVKTQTAQRDSDMKLIKTQVENIKDSLPKSLQKHREQQDQTLLAVQDELRSLKQLLTNRMKGKISSGPPPVSVVPSVPSPSSTPVSAPKNDDFVPSPQGAINTTEPAAASGSATASGSGSNENGKATIPAWQLAAQKNNSSSDSNKAGIPAWQLAAQSATTES